MRRVFDISQGQSKYTYAQQIIFPSETKDEDTYAYNDADQMTEGKMDKSTEVLASLVYTRDSDGQVKKTTSKGLPGAEVTENTYDENNRLTKYGSAEYKYDSANNATKEGSSTNTYNEADELEKGTGTTYAYDELGERTKMTPEKGPATTYGYDQAGNLTSVERPKEGEVAEIKDSYTYDGNGLRASQTISGTTSYLAWDMTKGLPLILSDGTNSYIYGPNGIPVEQISGSETPTYLHHDQQGSIRLLTGSAGITTGSITFDAYGNKVESTGTISPLGYDGQYANSDTGLIYMRARVYDPATAQFLTIDPALAISGAPYNYAGDNPVNYGDAVGLLWTPVAGAAGDADAACGLTIEIPGVDIGTCGAAAGATAAAAGVAIAHSIAGEESGNDEGEAELKKDETARRNCGEISPNFNDPAESPGEGWEWKGKGPAGSDEGSWVNPETGEKLYPDLGHGEPQGPHYDYTAPDGSKYRIYPDGRIEPKT